MHAFDFIVLLFSFVYAAAVAQVLGTAAEIVIAAKRIRLSWLNAGWMLMSLLMTCAWWIGLWDLHDLKEWTIGVIGFFFFVAAGFYVLTRMVSPRIPHDGAVDLVAFHAEEGRKYLVAFTALALITAGTNSVLGQASGAGQWQAQNLAVIPMALAAALAAVFIRTRWVQVAALVVELAAWAVYFGVLQAPLRG
jgi:hypothetical protein